MNIKEESRLYEHKMEESKLNEHKTVHENYS